MHYRRTRRVDLTFFISIILLLVLGISGAAQSSTSESTSRVQQTQKVEDRGGIKIVYELPRDARYVELQHILKESRLFDKIAAALNKELTLPRDLPVHFAECGVANAFFDPRSKSITMCYELIGAVAEDFAEIGASEEELNKATLHTAIFVFFHETGHALIDILKLPVTGKEEDAVDQLATLILIESGDEGEEAALDGATWFLLRADKTHVRDLAFWGEHSLDAQRFFNIACWVYGRDPKKHADLVTEGSLPEERAVGCADEYRKMSDGWTRLLAPYLKKQSGEALDLRMVVSVDTHHKKIVGFAKGPAGGLSQGGELVEPLQGIFASMRSQVRKPAQPTVEKRTVKQNHLLCHFS